jgi:hypothetical protein
MEQSRTGQLPERQHEPDQSKLQAESPRNHDTPAPISSLQPPSPSRPYQLGQRPTLASSRRLTVHDARSACRPSILTKQLSFKSSSAVPTLSKLAATSAASKSSDTANRERSASSVALSSRGSMAARDFSATDLLKQAISHR